LEDGEGGLEGVGFAFYQTVVVEEGTGGFLLGDSRVVEKAGY
jgi:hypothetical protein